MPDIFDLILGDHEQIRRLAAVLDPARSRDEPQITCAAAGAWEQLAVLLEMHTRAEEEICFLPMFGTGRDGTQYVDAVADHADIREAAREARLAPAGSARWWAAVGCAVTACTDHLACEESGVLAAFARRADFRLRQELGRQWVLFCAAWAAPPELAAGAGWPATREVTGTAAAMAHELPTREERGPWRG